MSNSEIRSLGDGSSIVTWRRIRLTDLIDDSWELFFAS